jgi:outer membrane protein insertion porin family
MVYSIHFEGNGNALSTTGDFQLRNAILQKENAPFAALNPRHRMVPLDQDQLRIDAWRIENWYAHRGFFDARFLGWQIEDRKLSWFRGRGSPQVVIVGHIRPGTPSKIRNIEIEGELQSRLRESLKNKLSIDTGDYFTLDAVREAEAVLLGSLQESGFALASVVADVDVWPRRCGILEEDASECFAAAILAQCDAGIQECRQIATAFRACSDDACIDSMVLAHRELLESKEKGRSVDVLFRVEKGPSCEIGEIYIEGPVHSPLGPVLKQLQIEPGSSYRASSLASAQQRIYGLGLFSVVSLSPDFSSGGSVIPLHLKLSESKYRQMRLGGGFQLESGKKEAQFVFDFQHRNLFNRLVQIEWNNQIGYSVLALDSSILGDDWSKVFADDALDEFLSQSGPTALSQLQFKMPIEGTPLGLQLELEYDQGVETAFRYLSPSLTPSVFYRGPTSAFGFKAIDIRFAYKFDYFLYRDLLIDLESIEGGTIGITNPYGLSYLSQQFILEGRDDPIFPRTGKYLELDLTEAGRWLGGGYDYWGVQLDARSYFPLLSLFLWKPFGSDVTVRRWLKRQNISINDPKGVLSTRLGSGLILPYWDGDATTSPAPYAEHFYLGGGSDVRGWRSRHLGPYVCQTDVICSTNTESVFNGTQLNRDIIPTGGTASLFGTIEFRRYWVDGYGLAAFADLGMVWDLPSNIDLRELNLSIGSGFRYKSPIGPLRLDLARRLDQPTYFAEESLWNVHFAFAESF